MRATSKAVIAALAAGFVSLSARADGDGSINPSPTNDGECTSVRAPIVTTFFVDGCESVFGLCTEGTISSGPLTGTTRFTVTSLDTETSAEFLGYTGILVITTPQGTLTIEDKGALSLLDGTFFEIDEITGGTDLFADTIGTLFSSGMSTPTGFDGWISGQICRLPGDFHGSD
jgi:hypothetical protein